MNKVRLSSNWDTSKNLTDRLLTQFLDDQSVLSNIQFVYDDSYDIVVFFNHITHPIKNGALSFIFPHEPSWTGVHQKSVPKGTKIFGFDSSNYLGDCIESPAFTFYGGRGPWIDTLDFWSYTNLHNHKFNKTKIISSSITEVNHPYGFPCLYTDRINLLNTLKKLGSIDFYGFGSSSPKRKDSLENYLFNIAIENSDEKNWITEKFYDGILCETIPIYYGCKNIKEIHPENGYILLETIRDVNYINSIIKDIQKNYQFIYNEKITGLRQIKEKYLHKENLLKKIISLTH